MKDFVDFLSRKTYNPVDIQKEIIEYAFKLTIKDSNYHLPKLTDVDIYNSIIHNGNELPVFLYRLGTLVSNETLPEKENALYMIHWLLKEVCSCEIYFNSKIGTGFLMVHGEGSIIGSRNNIGDGFVIHQGCTIGHKKNGMGKLSGLGCQIGNNVFMYANSSVIGEIIIGDNVVIGAHTLVKENIPANTVVINKSITRITQKD